MNSEETQRIKEFLSSLGHGKSIYELEAVEELEEEGIE